MTMLRPLLQVVVCLLALVAGGLSVWAQPAPVRDPSGIVVERSADPAALPGRIARLWSWVLDQQRRLMGEMSAAVRRIQSEDPLSAAIVLAVVSFVYGVLHAAGPGHGKFVISSYALANARMARRGILLAFMAALFQAISAIVLMGIVALAVRASQSQIKTTEAWLETASWG
ncbi:MAG: hypothetical protein ACREC6_08865, partial [Hyphomicrobiaceae bacterium]